MAVSGIDTPAEVGQLSVSTVNDQKEWESLNTSVTYYDSSGNAMAASTVTANLSNVAQVLFSTTEATHFSPYALTVATDPTAPATPSGLAVSTPTSSSALTITWTANTENDLSGYYAYRSTSSGGTFSNIATIAAGTNSYSDTGLSSNTTYYYKVAAYDSSSFESAATSAVSGATLNSGGSSGGGTTRSIISSSASSVVSSASSVTISTPATSVANPSSVARTVSPVFTRDLIRGSKGEDVRNLQKLLAKDKSIYPEGLVTGLFGPLTEKAVKKFQAKYNLPQVGKVSSATRELLTIVSSISDSSPASPSVAQSSSVSSKSSAKKAAAKTIVK